MAFSTASLAITKRIARSSGHGSSALGQSTNPSREKPLSRKLLRLCNFAGIVVDEFANRFWGLRDLDRRSEQGGGRTKSFEGKCARNSSADIFKDASRLTYIGTKPKRHAKEDLEVAGHELILKSRKTLQVAAVSELMK